jgi:hypothetical protein
VSGGDFTNWEGEGKGGTGDMKEGAATIVMSV